MNRIQKIKAWFKRFWHEWFIEPQDLDEEPRTHRNRLRECRHGRHPDACAKCNGGNMNETGGLWNDY